MSIYYKAVRPDGFDFYSGTVDYAGHLTSGDALPAKPANADAACCTDTVYHVSTSKADTLIGGSWPCRLFEVDADAVAEEDNKRGVLTLRVVRELPAWEALGPNGVDVVALIDRAWRLTADEVRGLSAAWDASWNAAQDAAQGAAWGAARNAAWGAARNAAWGAAAYAGAYAARDAAGALVVRDLITPEHFDTLHGPWSSVIN